jgi:hypothetical protein
MSLHFITRFCVVVAGVSSLISCQPPTPRIVKLERPAYAVVTASDATGQAPLSPDKFLEQANQAHDPTGLFPH